MSGLRLDILGWLLVPLVVVVIAVVWVRWRARPKGPVHPDESMAELARFRSAMARQTGQSDGPKAPGVTPERGAPNQ